MKCSECQDRNPSISHCPACHTTWTRLAHAHCTVCCAHFTSDQAFDWHLQFGDDGLFTGCADPGSLRRKDGKPKLHLDQHGWTKTVYSGPKTPSATVLETI